MKPAAVKWLLLIYKVPREPSALRVSIWRKLKQLGAIAQQDAAWILPATPRTLEQFQWLSSEIVEMGGDAALWSSDLVYEGGSTKLEQQFTAQVDAEYQAILMALKLNRVNLEALSKQYQQALQRDFFNSRLGRQVREKLLKAAGDNKR